MHHLVPQFILDNYRQQIDNGSFEAVTLFVDIVGFSTITDQLMLEGRRGAEQLANLMRDVLAPLIDCVYQHHGVVATLAGDAITALFPITQDADLQHGIQAALGMQALMRDLEQLPGRLGSSEVQARFGLSRGEVRWGIVRDCELERAAYYVSGELIDRAVEAQRKASANEIIVHYSLWEQLDEPTKTACVSTDHAYYHLQGAVQLASPRQPERSAYDVERSQAFFPRVLLDQQISGEFRHVISLFIHLPTVTVRTAGQLDIFMRRLFALQQRYAGLLNRLDFSDKGTHLLLFWGAPVSFENDVERALRFILELQAQISIPISAGLSYRLSHAGFIGSSYREEYTCYGRGVNLAARFMVEAERGDIWIDEQLAQRAATRFDREFEGAYPFKGFKAEEKVYVLYEAKEDAESFFSLHLLGRDAELASLRAFTSPLWQGHYAGVMLVQGEAGVGKSHLLYAFQSTDERAKHEPLWLTGQTDQLLRTALNPFRYLLKRFFSISVNQPEARNKRQFNRRLDNLIRDCPDEALADELDRTRSFLGALLGLTWPNSLYEQLEPQLRLDNTLIGLSTLFQVLSLLQPVILLIEDAHWLDEDSRNALRHLQQSCEAAATSFPLAIIMTARPQGQVLAAPSGDQLITLEALSYEVMAQLITTLLGNPVSDALTHLIHERSQGNPFFAEQMLRYLAEENLLVLREDVWYVNTDETSLMMPTDVRTVLVARIDRLQQHLKELVQTAAILGREFEVQLLSRLLQAHEADLRVELTRVEQEAIWIALSELRYLFKHALLRDAAYDMQLISRRTALHQLAVEAFESLYQHDLARHYPELAYHAEQAGLDDKALYYLERAGDSAKDAFENAQALDYYTRALKLLPAEATAERCELLFKRAFVYGWQGQHEAQLADLNQIQALTPELGLEMSIRLGLSLSNYYFDRSDYTKIIEVSQRTLELLTSGTHSRHLSEAHLLLGQAHYFRPAAPAYDTAEQHFLKAVDYAKKRADPEWEARTVMWLGMVYRYHHDAKAKEHFEQALALTTNLDLRAACLNRLGSIALRENDLDRAQALYEQTLALALQAGHRKRYGRVLHALGNLHAKRMDTARATHYYAQAATIAREIGDVKTHFDSLDESADVLAEAGQLAQAFEVASEHYRQSRGLDLFTSISILWVLTLICHWQGRYADALSYSEAYLETITPYDNSYDTIQACEEKVRLHIALGNTTQAHSLLSRAIRQIETLEVITTRYSFVIENTDCLMAHLKVDQALLALAMADKSSAQQAILETLALLEKLEQQSFDLDVANKPSSRLYVDTITVLQQLGLPQADSLIARANQHLMKLADKLGVSAEERPQVWREHIYRRALVQFWEAQQAR